MTPRQRFREWFTDRLANASGPASPPAEYPDRVLVLLVLGWLFCRDTDEQSKDIDMWKAKVDRQREQEQSR